MFEQTPTPGKNVLRHIPVCGIEEEDIFLAGDGLHQVLEIVENERYQTFALRVLSEHRQWDWDGRWICLDARDTLEVFVGATSVQRGNA